MPSILGHTVLNFVFCYPNLCIHWRIKVVKVAVILYTIFIYKVRR
jgi:hypothetical protein